MRASPKKEGTFIYPSFSAGFPPPKGANGEAGHAMSFHDHMAPRKVAFATTRLKRKILL